MRFSIIIFLFGGFLQAQEISLTVKNKTDSSTLAFVNVSILNARVVTNTDVNGNFTFNFKKYTSDTLVISHIGFESKKIAIQELLNDPKNFKSIYLVESDQQLEEVVINSSSKNYGIKHKLGVRKKWFYSRVGVQFGMQQGLFIQNEKEKSGKLVELSFWVAEDEELFYNKRLTWFRVKFYNFDQKNNEPKDLLSFRDILLKPKNNTKQLKVDLSEYHIAFPENGIFVVLETVNPKPNEKDDSKYLTYPRLIYSKDKVNNTWTSYRNQDWFQSSDKHMHTQAIAGRKKKYYINPAIEIKVKYEK